MKVEQVGLRLAVLSDLPCPAWQAALRIQEAKLPGLVTATPCWETVGLEFSDRPDYDAIRALESLLADVRHEVQQPAHHQVRVVFDGVDLPEAAERLGLTQRELIQAFVSAHYEVAAIGFSPGFPYLRGLPAQLQGLPRRPQPRPRVPERSLAITGDQVGIYPSATPGGWNLIGTVAGDLFTWEPLWSRFAVGDLVRFEEIE